MSPPGIFTRVRGRRPRAAPLSTSSCLYDSDVAPILPYTQRTGV